MRRPVKIALLLVVLFALTLLLPAFVHAEQAKYNFKAVGYTKEDIKKKLQKKYEFDYKPYLSGKKKLGFSPDEGLYRKVYYYITLRYVEPVDNKVLLDGVFAEVTRLLKQAKVDPSALASIQRKGTPMQAIVKVYSDKVNPDLIKLACIRGMLEGLNDPHSTLMLPDEYQRLKESMSGGNFTGIGVYIMQDPDNYNWLTISEPIEGTPAYKAGLKPGDIVMAIDGESTKGQPIDLAVAKIRGKENTTVKLTIKRKGNTKPLIIPIKRSFIHVSSVSEKMLEGKVGYVKLRVYGSDTGQELDNALGRLEAQGAKSFILDLRNNSGGLIDSAVDVCSMFLPKSSPIVTVIERSGSKRIHRAKGGEHSDLPMVVMINELSASASEITAGALHDEKRATLVGEKSFGKGSVQELMGIDNGSKPAALKLTIALFYTPNGTKINKVGVEPDIKVPMDIQNTGLSNISKDIQLKRAIKFLKEKTK